MAESSHEFGTIIGPDAVFKGDLSFDSAAKVLGKFEGSINAKGKIHIADGSVCKATITAKEVAVEGVVEGNVEAADRVEVKPTGSINGDIVASRMVVSDGASINGHCRIGAENGVKGRASTEVKPAERAAVQQGQAVKKDNRAPVV